MIASDDFSGGLYEALGVPRAISCIGPVTVLGGMPLSDRVIDAMRRAATSKVDLYRLNEAAGERIAAMIGVEGAFVTTGAAAGWQLAAAACMTGTDPARIARLPGVVDDRCEIVIHRKHRCNFDHALRAAGARLVQFGYARDRTERWELEAAINDKTVAVAYVAAFGEAAAPSLKEVVSIAHAHDVPVIVDAAPALPPRSALIDLPATGADLCCFSGGKDIGGPQNSGFVAGRSDLVQACALNANPNHNSIGRPFKVNAEAIVGLLIALEDYLSREPGEDDRRWLTALQQIGAHVSDRDGIDWSIERAENGLPVPILKIAMPDGATEADATAEVLRAGDPQIWVGIEQGNLVINPQALHTQDVDLVADRIVAARAARSGLFSAGG